MIDRLRAGILSLRDLLATAWPIVLVSLVGFAVAYHFVAPAPPRSLVMVTGSEGGAYYAFAKRYAAILARSGVTLEVRPSAGAVENVARLRRGEADVGFVQSGVDVPPAGDDDATLRSLGSMYYEPIWVFTRGPRHYDRLHQLAGQRIAVGPEGSGTRDVALKLLEANGIARDSRNLLPLGSADAVRALRRGEIDAAFILAGVEAPVVQTLLHERDVQVMDFSQAEAYVRRFPFLTRVTLPHGVVDLVRDEPAHDTSMLAATANLIVTDELHPALASLLLEAATEVHSGIGFFQRNGEFPAYIDRGFEESPDARRYYKSGPPFLQRFLPFWVAAFVDRMMVMLLPLVALLIPMLKLAPAIYTWRIRSRIFRLYGELKYLENDIRDHYSAPRRDDYLAQLDRIEDEANTRRVPLAFTDLVYTLREHINLVRRRVQSLAPAPQRDGEGDA